MFYASDYNSLNIDMVFHYSYIYPRLWFLQDVEIDEEVDVIISEWMGYMLLYEVLINILVVV